MAEQRPPRIIFVIWTLALLSAGATAILFFRSDEKVDDIFTFSAVLIVVVMLATFWNRLSEERAPFGEMRERGWWWRPPNHWPPRGLDDSVRPRGGGTQGPLSS